MTRLTRSFKFVWIATAIVLFSTWFGNAFAQSPPLVTKRIGNLTWQECEISKATYEGKFKPAPAACYRKLRTSMQFTNRDRQNLGVHDLSADGIELRIGKDVYRTAPSGMDANYVFTRNGAAIAKLTSEFVTFSPNRSLQNVGGKAVWEFAGAPETFTVLVEEKDMRASAQIQQAYEPYGINGKLIFVGQKDDRFFVMYDGQKIGEEFDQIFIAYCCEPAAYTVHQGDGAYLFQAKRGDRYYLVRISA
jgi:hypothetical protein